ncbi:MAG: RNA polymerase sporulation sigma factor SigE [Ruminococcus bromii]|nr:RNA polymerase sporulation sigma factor SigE [Ruminococcus bromii]
MLTALFQKCRLFFARLLLRLNRDECHYINGPETLPPPLTREEEQRVLQDIRAGKPGARDPLITHNLRLVVYIAKKFESPSANVEDLISIGTIGLIKAVNTFSVERNIKLATYASRCIENEILMYLRKSAQLKNEVSLDDPLNVDWDGNELSLSDLLGSDPDVVNRGVEQEAEKQVLLEAVARLQPRERQIIELRFGLHNGREHTQKEVADTLGISQSYISRLEKRIIERLRKDLEKAG